MLNKSEIWRSEECFGTGISRADTPKNFHPAPRSTSSTQLRVNARAGIAPGKHESNTFGQCLIKMRPALGIIWDPLASETDVECS